MKYLFILKKFTRAQLWLDEAPPADFIASSVVERLLTPKKRLAASHRIAAVEVVIPLGGRIVYALLGGELIKSDVDGLEVRVADSVGHETILPRRRPPEKTLSASP